MPEARFPKAITNFILSPNGIGTFMYLKHFQPFFFIVFSALSY